MRIRFIALAATVSLNATAGVAQTVKGSSPISPAVLAQRVAEAARATTRLELATGIARACEIETWQFTLRGTGNAVRLEHSPTLVQPKMQCARSVVSQSRFRLLR